MRRIGKLALIPLALALALTSVACGSAQAAPDEAGGTLADLVRQADEPLATLPGPADREPEAESLTVDVATYALREGYQWKDGWWWRDRGAGVLHALFDELDHYGVGVMLTAQASDSEKGQAIDRMVLALRELEPNRALVTEAIAFFESERGHYAERTEAEYSASTTLQEREIEAVFWRSESAQGPTIGFMLIVQKP